VLHDWGGDDRHGLAVRTGAGAAACRPNTAAFPLPRKSGSRGVAVGRDTRSGAWLILRHNAFFRAGPESAPSAGRCPPTCASGLLAPYDSHGAPHRRSAIRANNPARTSGFQAADIVSETERGLDQSAIADVDMLGMRDSFSIVNFSGEVGAAVPGRRGLAVSRLWALRLGGRDRQIVAAVRRFLTAHPFPRKGRCA